MMSMPARSWSRMASWVASSNVSFTSVAPYSPALILSRAVQNQPGKPWLPMTCVGINGRVAGMEGAYPNSGPTFDGSAELVQMVGVVPGHHGEVVVDG